MFWFLLAFCGAASGRTIVVYFDIVLPIVGWSKNDSLQPFFNEILVFEYHGFSDSLRLKLFLGCPNRLLFLLLWGSAPRYLGICRLSPFPILGLNITLNKAPYDIRLLLQILQDFSLIFCCIC